MENGIQSSFIPKDAGKVTVAPRLERGGGLGDLLLLISIVMLVASGTLAGGVFLYKQYLASTAAERVEQLKSARAAFQPALIQQLTRLDDRMRAADAVLTAHLAPTLLFSALEKATLTTVGFSSLDLQATDPNRITIHMNGVAQSVNSIALEADIMSKHGVITSPIFSGISRQQDGVHFDLVANVNTAAISYIGYVNGTAEAAGAVPTSPTQTQPFEQNATDTENAGAATGQSASTTPPTSTND